MPTTPIPLTLLRGLQSPNPANSLGDLLAETIVDSRITTLLDCLPSTPSPALYSPDLSRGPLLHDTVRYFVQNFVLPHSASHDPLGPNDRVMIVIPTGPENALALLSLASYHTCVPVNASCTAAELLDDARRLNVKAIVTTRDAEERLELRRLVAELGCEIIYIASRASDPCGLFDMDTIDEALAQLPSHSHPTKLHGLGDQSLILHTSGTSGKKKFDCDQKKQEAIHYSLYGLVV